jgi:diaminohydroxyphosphoribosylaminopyrimidine deaminase / 5-amino-6-(5-phosphoribosylamino)uracil reductase
VVTNDHRFMRRALAMARLGLGYASPNPSVGCVLVKSDKIVGEAFHNYSERDHAEVRAVRQAGRHARGATAYVSLEPCTYHGRTPPCADLLIDSGIQRVVVSMIDPNPLVCGKGIERLRAAGVRVEYGLMQNEAGRIIEPFGCHVRTGLPLVVAKVGMSLDGRIAAPKGRDHWISSAEARKFGQSLRHQLDAILVGVGTILDDDPQLTYRGAAPKARTLIRVILDSRLRTPPSARLFHADPSLPVIIFCSSRAPRNRRRALERKGAEVVSLRLLNGRLDLKAALRELGRRNVLGVLVEGGSTVHGAFVSAELVDKFYFNIAPLVLGGNRSVPAVGGPGYSAIPDAPRFEIVRHFRAGCDVILETYPSYSRSILSPWLRLASAPSSPRSFLGASRRR